MPAYEIRPLQLRILEILLAVDKVCREHGLRYYIFGQGLCLGLYATKVLFLGTTIWTFVCRARIMTP